MSSILYRHPRKVFGIFFAIGITALGFLYAFNTASAAVSYVGVSNLIAVNGTNNPGTITPNAGTTNGDLLVFYHYSRATGGNETVTLPSGFTTVFNSVTVNRGLVAVGWRIRQAGDTTYSAATTNHSAGGGGETILEWIETYRSTDTVNPIVDYTPTLSTWTSSLNIGPISAPTTATVADGDTVVVFGGRFENTTAQTTLTGDNLTWTARTRDDTTQGGDASAVTQTGLNSSGTNQTITAKTITTTGTAQAGAGRMFIIRKIPPTATLSASPTTCTILSGASTCTVPFTWSITNATSPNLYNSSTATQYSTSASGSGVSFAITNGSNTVQARDSGTVLASISVSASCTSGTTWNGSSCAPIPAVPTVTTPTVTSVTTTGATLGANVTSLGVPASISARGTCWGTSPSPATNCLAEGGASTGVFTHARTGMSSNTFYYYRGYATNSTGTGYSTDGTFTTNAGASGSVSASPTTCTILSGASTCTVPFTWSITNATSPNLYNSTTATQYSTATTGNDVSYAITNGSNTVQARDSNMVLASTSVTGSCDVGTSWNGSVCAIDAFTITSSSGANGNVTPSGITNVASGGSQTYNITPDSGYDVATLVVDSISIATSTTYTFSNVTTNHTISATFSLLPITHTITSSVGSNGTINPLGAITVADAASKTFDILPDSGFTIETLVVDSVSIATSTTYTFNNVITNHTISATFALIPPPPGSFTIVAVSGTNGSVTPNGSTVIIQGGSQTYTITPDSGYNISELIIDSFSTATSTTYTFTNVQENHTIEANFTLISAPSPIAQTGSAGTSRPTTVIFSGKAFPGGTVSISNKELRTEDLVKQSVVASSDGSFDISFVGIIQGLQSFGLNAKDKDGRTSQTKFFLFDTVSEGLFQKNILISPTVDISGTQITRGASASVFGYAAPNHILSLYLDGILYKESSALADGSYKIDISTSALDFGQHSIKIKQLSKSRDTESDFSITKTFLVSHLSNVRTDFNSDGKIDIRDWSIFLFRWATKASSTSRTIDLNSDGKIDIADFSIFIKTIRK